MTKHEKILTLLAKPFNVVEGKYHCTQFIPISGSVGTGAASKLQGVLKRWPQLYQFLVDTFSPVLLSKNMRTCLADVLACHGPDSAVVNLGCGPRGLPGRPDIINVDIASFDQVDICANATDLPFGDSTVDCILNLAMLEHVRHAQKVIEEMHRVLKPGGTIFGYVPFCQPLHAAPSDFCRWTLSGACELFDSFEIVESGVGAGPTSGWLWITVEWMSMLLSFGSTTLKDLLALAFMLLFFPLKHLDRLMERHPDAERIASGLYLRGRK
ncbi:MAG: class I SAM-dependent methyltransferase [Desulfovibrio sp.]|nr:class I SAM-dependent methyltransferase [Desulfovibrio sp.]MBI4959165.1 class I SAM-dependent methyltransferase [Desulfovibrio sp.]